MRGRYRAQSARSGGEAVHFASSSCWEVSRSRRSGRARRKRWAAPMTKTPPASSPPVPFFPSLTPLSADPPFPPFLLPPVFLPSLPCRTSTRTRQEDPQRVHRPRCLRPHRSRSLGGHSRWIGGQGPRCYRPQGPVDFVRCFLPPPLHSRGETGYGTDTVAREQARRGCVHPGVHQQPRARGEG
jgi:hypothetical protein